MTKKTNTPSDIDKVYGIINLFMDCFIKVDKRIKKSELALTAVGEELDLGSLDWLDVIVELENVFQIKIETDGLFGCNVEKLLRTCTQELVKQGRLTTTQEALVFERYKVLHTWLNAREQQGKQKTAVVKDTKTNTK